MIGVVTGLARGLNMCAYVQVQFVTLEELCGRLVQHGRVHEPCLYTVSEIILDTYLCMCAQANYYCSSKLKG